MRFVKASERLPEFISDSLYIRNIKTKGRVEPGYFRSYAGKSDGWELENFEWLDESLPTDDMSTAFQNEPVNFLLSNALRHLTQDQQRELCNALQERLPIPASIEDEAKRLYPYSGSLLQNDTLENRFAEVKRRVHITCARQYTDTIEKLRAENEKIRKGLERLTEENDKLSAENHTQSEELGELKNITDGLEGRIINQQRDLLVAYRNKIALTPDATVESILAMLEDDIKTLRTMDGGEIIKNIKR